MHDGPAYNAFRCFLLLTGWSDVLRYLQDGPVYNYLGYTQDCPAYNISLCNCVEGSCNLTYLVILLNASIGKILHKIGYAIFLLEDQNFTQRGCGLGQVRPLSKLTPMYL